MTYAEKLRDARWQRVSHEVLRRANYRCETCQRGPDELHGITLQAHHKFYERGRDPWEYPFEDLKCLCDPCHEQTEIALLALRQLFAEFDFFHVSGFAADLLTACKSEPPLAVLNALRFTLSTIAK